MYNLGSTYLLRDETRSLAKTELENCLEIRKKVFGAEDRSVADTLSALAILNAGLSQYPIATKYHMNALELYNKIMPLADPDINVDGTKTLRG